MLANVLRAWLLGMTLALSALTLGTTALDATRPQPRLTSRQQAWEDAGPPPSPDAVPVGRYRTKAGTEVKAHWRQPSGTHSKVGGR